MERLIWFCSGRTCVGYSYIYMVAAISRGVRVFRITAPPSAPLPNHRSDVSTIYESTPANFARTGSMALCPNALRVLDHLGLYSSLKSQGYSHDGGTMLSTSGTTLGRLILGSEETYGYHALRLYRRTPRNALVEEAQRCGIEIHFDMKCVGIEQETDL